MIRGPRRKTGRRQTVYEAQKTHHRFPSCEAIYIEIISTNWRCKFNLSKPMVTSRMNTTSIFPFTSLPAELIDIIIRFAVQSHCSHAQNRDIAEPKFYSTALSLCLVSHNIRSHTVPHFLHIVFLTTSPQFYSFISTLILQQRHRSTQSRLHVDYGIHIKRFWTSEAWDSSGPDCSYKNRSNFSGGFDPPDPTVESQVKLDSIPNYLILFDALRMTTSIGLTYNSYNILYEGLSDQNAQNQTEPYLSACRSLCLQDYSWRWNPLLTTFRGQQFLRRITHLTLWLEARKPEEEVLGADIPVWVKDVPFSNLVRLVGLAVPGRKGWVEGKVNQNDENDEGDMKQTTNAWPSKMWIFERKDSGVARDFWQRAINSTQLEEHGLLVDIDLASSQSGAKCENVWARAFAEGQDAGLWRIRAP